MTGTAAAVIETAGGPGEKFLVRALDDYAAEIPLEDATVFEAIPAVK